MNGYEKIIKTIRSESNRDRDAYPLKLAVMSSAVSCKYGQIELDSDDLLFADHLTYFDSTQNRTWTRLKAGDQVVISRISSNRFLILDLVKEVG